MIYDPGYRMLMQLNAFSRLSLLLEWNVLLCRMPAEQWTRQAAAWLLLLCLASSATGLVAPQPDPDLRDLHGPASLSSRTGASGSAGTSGLAVFRVKLSQLPPASPQPHVGGASVGEDPQGSRQDSIGGQTSSSSSTVRSASWNESSVREEDYAVVRRILSESASSPPQYVFAPAPAPGEQRTAPLRRLFIMHAASHVYKLDKATA